MVQVKSDRIRVMYDMNMYAKLDNRFMVMRIFMIYIKLNIYLLVKCNENTFDVITRNFVFGFANKIRQ